MYILMYISIVNVVLLCLQLNDEIFIVMMHMLELTLRKTIFFT